MATEQLLASSSIAGGCADPVNAVGVADGTYTTNIDNDSWTHEWHLDNPAGVVDASQTVTIDIRCRKQDGTADPDIDSVQLLDGAASIGIDSTGWSITSLTGQSIQASIASAAWPSDGSDLRVKIVTSAAGGSPAKRAAVQVDEFDVTITTSTAPSSETLPATTTLTVTLALKKDFYRTHAATTTITAGAPKLVSAFRIVSATTTVTAGLTRSARFFRTLNATATIAADVTRRLGTAIALAASTAIAVALNARASYYLTLAASSTITAATSLSKKFYRTFTAATTIVADVATSGGELFFEALDAASTVTADLAFRLKMYRSAAATTTVAATVSLGKKFFRILAVPVVEWVLGQLPSGPDRGEQGSHSRILAAIFHDDALMRFLLDNETDSFTSIELVGALNQINGTTGIEYWEARKTYLAS